MNVISHMHLWNQILGSYDKHDGTNHKYGYFPTKDTRYYHSSTSQRFIMNVYEMHIICMRGKIVKEVSPKSGNDYHKNRVFDILDHMVRPKEYTWKTRGIVMKIILFQLLPGEGGEDKRGSCLHQ